jgi:Electron transfer DM13
MKFIQASILGLAFLLLVSSTKAVTSTQTSINLVNDSSPKTLSEGKTEISKTTRQGQLIAATLKNGSFVKGEQPTRGGASIMNIKGQSFLQLDSSFKTSNQGPDLVVVLHRSRNVLGATKPPNYALKGSSYVVLAPLRKYQGAQRYAIPEDINLEDYHSAVIWCRKFNATFGVARLG